MGRSVPMKRSRFESEGRVSSPWEGSYLAEEGSGAMEILVTKATSITS